MIVSVNRALNDRTIIKFYNDNYVFTVTIYEEDKSVSYNCNSCALTKDDIFSSEEYAVMYIKVKGECVVEASVDQDCFPDYLCRISLYSNNSYIELHLPSLNMNDSEICLEPHSKSSKKLFKMHRFIVDMTLKEIEMLASESCLQSEYLCKLNLME